MITVKYFCHKCMTKKGEKPEVSEFVEVSVPQRKEGQIVTEYVEEVARVVAIHHSFHHCNETNCDLLFPMDNDKGIGYPKEA